MTPQDALEYEVGASSWWLQFVWWGWGQHLAGRYMARKVRRKWKRLQKRRALAERVRARGLPDR